MFSYQFGDPDRRNNADSAPHVPRSVVVNPYFDWDVDRPPRTPYHETVIYEAHVRGLTGSTRSSQTSSAAPTWAWPTRR